MHYDVENIMADIDFQTFVDICVNELGYEIKPEASLETGKVNCICHYHNDGKKPGKRFGSTSLISKNDYKGIYCFACGTSKSFVSMVMDEKQMNFGEAIRFIMEKSGLNPDTYAIPGTETEWERHNKVETRQDPLCELMPPLSSKELKLIGLKDVNYAKNYEILNEYDAFNKPHPWELEKGENLLKIEEENPLYIEGSLPEYPNFLSYTSGVKTIGGSEEEPFITKYLLVRKISGYSLNDLYVKDKVSYWRLILLKTWDTIKTKEEEKQTANNFTTYNLKKELKILNEILNRYLNNELVNLLQRQSQSQE